MFSTFFLGLRQAGLPVSLREYLDLLRAVREGVAGFSVEDFYYLSRACLVKDERHLDRFDRVFGRCFEGIETGDDKEDDDPARGIPEEWLRRLAELNLSEEERAQIQALGGLERLMEELRKRLAEQKERHQGGNRWIGTAGTSPFGAYGDHPEGVHIGQQGSRRRRAVNVWDRREFRNLDDTVELGTRNIKVALRRLRRFAREGAATELDLGGTIEATARNGGYLDLKMRPERHNKAKVLLFLDVGGSMDDHVRACEELFSAARSEFKHLVHYYFHNCVYEAVWKDNRRRHGERVPMWEVMRTYGADYRVIWVGDAAMGPYELVSVGGNIEGWNEEPGRVWLERVLGVYPKSVWLNPLHQGAWGSYGSVGMVREIFEGRMYPLTLAGLDDAMRALAR